MEGEPAQGGYCRLCGAANPSHARFCPRCGAAVAAGASADTGAERSGVPALLLDPARLSASPPVYAPAPITGAAWLVLLAGVAAAVIGAAVSVFLPWVTVSAGSSAYSATASASGTSVGGDGWWVLVLGGAAVLIQVIALARGREERTLQGIGELILGAAVAYIALRDVSDISSTAGSLGGAFLSAIGVGISAGVGLWLAAIAGVLVAIGGVWHLSLTRQQAI